MLGRRCLIAPSIIHFLDQKMKSCHQCRANKAEAGKIERAHRAEKAEVIMMGYIKAFIAAAFLLGTLVFSPQNAVAANISKQQITSILSEQGYAVRDFNDSMVAVVVGDHVVLVAVDGADGDISYITYINGVSANLLGYEFLSQFNSEVKFGRAYVDRDGDIALQMDRNAAGGVSSENIESDFDVFLILISKFLADIENISLT